MSGPVLVSPVSFLMSAHRLRPPFLRTCLGEGIGQGGKMQRRPCLRLGCDRVQGRGGNRMTSEPCWGIGSRFNCFVRVAKPAAQGAPNWSHERAPLGNEQDDLARQTGEAGVLRMTADETP